MGAALGLKGVAWNWGAVNDAMARHSSQVSQPLQGAPLEPGCPFAKFSVVPMCIGQSAGMVAAGAISFTSRVIWPCWPAAATCADAMLMAMADAVHPRMGRRHIKKAISSRRMDE